MGKRPFILTAAALAAWAVAAAGGAASGAPAQAPAPASTTALVERPATFRFVDVAPRGHGRVSAGDRSVMTSALLHADATRRAGTSVLECTAVRDGAPRRVPFHCTGTVRLADGTFAVDGVISGASPRMVLAVLGGTGAYAGRHGTFESAPRGHGPAMKDTLRLEPAGGAA
jgi:hypothetical protein